MPRKPKAQPAPDPVVLTCGVCRFCKDVPNASPTCHGMPPTAMFDDDGDLMSVRPIVRLIDLACSLHQPRLNS